MSAEQQKHCGTDKISILMTTYNVAPYIEESVQSVLAQTYEDFELIIVDNISSDGTYEKLLEFQKKDPRIHLIQSRERCGIGKALNDILPLATGDFIARADGDDVPMPTWLENLKNYLDTHLDVALVGSNAISINEMDEILSYKRYPQSPTFVKKCNKIMSSVIHPIWLARTEMYKRLNGYRDLPFAEDYDFLLRGENLGYRYANVPEFLLKKRMRQNNAGNRDGLAQEKLVRYIKRLHRLEKRKKQDMLSVEKLPKLMESSARQKQMYAVAWGHLNMTIRSAKPSDKIKHIIGAAKSGYVLNYIVKATLFRMLVHIEAIMNRE